MCKGERFEHRAAYLVVVVIPSFKALRAPLSKRGRHPLEHEVPVAAFPVYTPVEELDDGWMAKLLKRLALARKELGRKTAVRLLVEDF
jgi:hypothetical protein